MENNRAFSRLRFLARELLILAVVSLFIMLFIRNLSPFKPSVNYEIDLEDGSGNIVMPGPLLPSAQLGVDEEGQSYQIAQFEMVYDRVTFRLKIIPDKLEKGTLTMRYRGDPDELLVEVRDTNNEHSITMPIHCKAINNLDWPRVDGNGLTLYQREEEFGTVEEFLSDFYLLTGNDNPDIMPVVARYFYDPLLQPGLDSSLVNGGMVIETALRGPHTFSVYVKDEPLEFSFTKQDINQQQGEDILNIRIFNEDSDIYREIVPDDGDATALSHAGQPQNVGISVPGLPEGIYKVSMSCNYDVAIRSIEAKQKYIWFDTYIYPADSKLYNLGPTKESVIYADSGALQISTKHKSAFQSVWINEIEKLSIDQVDKYYEVNLTEIINKLRLEESDLELYSPGMIFCFSEDTIRQFGNRSILNLDSLVQSLLQQVPGSLRYIITSYSQPVREEDWSVNTVTFDLREFNIHDDELVFIIEAPGLNGSLNEVTLGSIEVSLEAPGASD